MSKLARIYLLTAFVLASGLIVFASPAVNFDYDGKSDLAIYRSGFWWMLSSESNTVTVVQWGLETDRIAPGDYDGDGITDLTIYRPDTGAWWVRRSRDGQAFIMNWGISTDNVVPADYDGDGATDFAVWRPETGIWYLRTSNSGYVPSYFKWGKLGDQPIPADYDGDRREDLAVYRVTEGIWYIIESSTGSPATIDFGAGSCCSKTAIAQDFTGDLKADLVHYTSDGIWLIRASEDETVRSSEFGVTGPIVYSVPADYDGDGRSDLGIYRDGDWYTFQSLTATQVNYRFGLSQDIPLQAVAFLNQ